jgi:Fe-S cluster assembly iron-binding protein IscA
MFMIKLEPNAAQAIKAVLTDRESHGPLRITLQFAGCCDPSLGLSVDVVNETDLVQELEGLTFVISPETYQLVGEVTIAYADKAGEMGFIITSSKPVSEWEGFAHCRIKI